MQPIYLIIFIYSEQTNTYSIFILYILNYIFCPRLWLYLFYTISTRGVKYLMSGLLVIYKFFYYGPNVTTY